MKKILFYFVFALMLAFTWATQNALANIIYVKHDASGANTGANWSDAFTDLQSALTAAISDDEIWVTAGTYKPTSGLNRSMSFVMKEGVDIYGGFTGIETERDERDWLQMRQFFLEILA